MTGSRLHSLFLLAAPAAVVSAAAGCAPGGYYHTSQGALDSLLTSQAEMMKRISPLQKQVDANREAQNLTRANTDARLLEISQRLDVLDGQLEDSGVRVTQLSQKVDTVKYELSAADSARAASGMAHHDSTGSLDPEAMYQAAYSDIRRGPLRPGAGVVTRPTSRTSPTPRWPTTRSTGSASATT